MNIKNKNEILNKLEIMKDKNKYNNSDITFLEKLTKIRDFEIRYEVAEVLSGRNEIEINKISKKKKNKTLKNRGQQDGLAD